MRREALPVPGIPYTLFLRHGWYTPRAQRVLTRLGFQFAAPNAQGHAEPSLTTVPLQDMRLSDLMALVRPTHLKLSIVQAHFWYGRRLRKDEVFWYLCLYRNEAL